MKKYLVISALFILFLAGNIILPSFFNFRENVMLLAFLVSMLAVRPVTPTRVIWGVLAALVVELAIGLPPGTAAISFLALAFCLVVAARFINVSPFSGSSSGFMVSVAGQAVLSVFLFALFSLIFVSVNGLVTATHVAWANLPLFFAPLLVLGQVALVSVVMSAAEGLPSRI